MRNFGWHRAAFGILGLALCLAAAASAEAEQGPPGKSKIVEIDLSKLPADLAKQLQQLSSQSKESEKKGPPKGTPGAGKKEKEDDDKDTGPPSQIPPPSAKGKKLADFIKGQLSKGVSGEGLGKAINRERGKLGLTDDDKDDDSSSSPSKGKKD